MDETQNLARVYYSSWANQDKKKVVECLSESNFTFTSPQDTLIDVRKFIETCWIYSKDLTGVEFLREVYDNNQAFLIMLWHSEDGSSFTSAEYVRTENGRIIEILVVNNDPSFNYQ